MEALVLGRGIQLWIIRLFPDPPSEVALQIERATEVARRVVERLPDDIKPPNPVMDKTESEPEMFHLLCRYPLQPTVGEV